MNQCNYMDYFPFENAREEQIECLEYSIEYFSEGKKFVILECPVGVGKSAIAICLSSFFEENNELFETKSNKSYILTTQKILQQQYVNDFSSKINLGNVWSKSDYKCQHRKNVSCKLSRFIAKMNPNEEESIKCKKHCVYERDKNIFLNGNISITNMSYFLHNYDVLIKNEKRGLMIIDECHNLENEIINYVSLTFSKKYCEEFLGIEWPNFNNYTKFHQFKEWLYGSYFDGLEKKGQEIYDKLKNSKKKNKSFYVYLNEYDKMSLILSKIGKIKEFNNVDWILSCSDEESFCVKPLHPDRLSGILYSMADKILMMSGTILDHKIFCKNNGIPLDKCAFIKFETPFLPQNRPVIYSPVGNMSYKKIDNTLPSVVRAVNLILDQHKKEKGIIHCHTYKIANYIKNNIDNDRLLFHDSNNRIDVLNEHINSFEPTVIVSPSFTEGIDLYGNLSRFQIVCKMPFPFLGDNFIKTKMKICKGWYEWMTVKTIIQELGRSVRSYDDYAVSYILDSDWEMFLNRNQNLFPDWFKKSFVVI